MSLTKEQLLQKRVVCTGYEDNHYPNSEYLPGEILYRYQAKDTPANVDFYCRDQVYSRLIDGFIHESHIDKHPHLFRVLPWYESRTADEMPEYVKRLLGGNIMKVDKWYFEPDEIGLFDFIGQDTPTSRHAQNYTPATKEEYESFINATDSIK